MTLIATACTGGRGASPTTDQLPATSTPSTPSTSTTTTTTASTSTTEMPTVEPPPFTSAISGIGEATLAHSWQDGCPVGPDDLALVEVTYVDFAGVVEQGTMVVSAEHGEGVVNVFRKLYEGGYPIASMVPIGELPPGAEAEPGYVNTSGFHCRFAIGTNRWSEHAMGRAVDINPHLNPYIKGGEIWPSGSEAYLDRTLGEPGMITEGDLVVTSFDAIGWEWGGRWRTLKDYHHFSSTGR